MSDLTYTVKAEGVKDVEALARSLESLHKVLDSGKGSGKALEEVRKLIVGFKGQAGVFEEMRNSMQSMQQAMADMSNKMPAVVRMMTQGIAREMKVVVATMRTDGAAAGKAFTDGMSQNLDVATTVIQRQGKSIAAAARAEATKIYEAMVAGQPNAKVTTKGMEALFKLQEAGATLSPYHKGILENWKKSSAETYRALQSQIATEAKELAELAKVGQQKIVAQVKAATIETSAPYSSLKSGRTYNMAQYMLDQIYPPKALFEAEAAKRLAEFKALQNSAVAQAKSATITTELPYSSLKSGRTYNMAQYMLDQIYPPKALFEAEAAKRLAEFKALQNAAVAQAKSATITTELPYSSLKSGRTYNMAQYMLDQIYPPKALFEAEAAKRLAEFKALQDRAARQYATAANMPSGAYTKFNPSTGAKGATVGLQEPVIPKDKPGDVLNLASAFDKLALSGNDVHSMARGLASGFNLLWLTWGNLVPLFIGAGISNGFMQTAKTGVEVAHTMKTIAVLGGNTAEEVAALNVELTNLGKSGPFGPKEIAESMKTLSLAGLKANEILAVTKDVLNFSVAGTTDLKTAADSLVSISTAFGMGAQGFGRVADVVSKAAAESKSSVESFANAMKTASVINKQYGVSLEDTATGIAALSQLGIEGTAAGTALRNMYADLSGRSMQVAKVLKSQGIEMRTATGEFRPMLEVVAELNNKLLKLDGISQKNLLQAILSERGAKGMVELLQMIQQEAKNMGSGLSNALAELKQNITESYGFAAISAAQLAQTTQESFKAVKATLSTSMNEAYQAMEPTLYLLADTLKKTFSSPEFVSGLTTMVSFVANLARSFVELTKFVVEHAEAIALVSAAYVGVTMLIRNKTAAMAAATAATTADTAATVANNAAKAGAAGALGTMARILPGIGTAVSIAAVAWSAYDLWQNRAKDTAKEAADVYNTNVVNTLKDQADKLERLNALRATGISLSEAQARLDAEGKVQDSTLGARGGLKSALAEVSEAENELAKVSNNFFITEGLRASALEKAQKRVSEATQKAVQAQVQVNNAAADSETQLLRIREESRKKSEWMDAEAKARQEKLAKGFGTGIFNLTDKSGKGAMPNVRQEMMVEQKALTEITKARDAEVANTKRSYDLQKQLLDNKHKNELISRTEYAIQAAAQTEDFEAKQLKSLQEYNDKYQDQSLKAIAELKRNEELYREAGNKDRADNFASLAETQREAAIRIAKDTAEKVANIQEEASTRNQIIIQDMAGEASKLLKADDKIWKDRQDKLSAAKDLEAINEQYKFLNTSVFSVAEGEKAYAMAMVETMSSVKAQNKTLEELANHLQAVADAQYAIIMTKDYAGQEDGMSQADADRLAKLLTAREAVQKLRDRMSANIENGFKQGAAEGTLAMEKVMKEKRDALVGGISGAIETGIFEGGDAGAAALRKTIEDELLRKPFRAFIQAGVSFLLNGAIGGISSLLGGGSGGGGISNILNMFSGARAAYAGYGALTGGFSNTIGTMWANTTGGGLDALLASNGAYGTAPVTTTPWATAAGPAAAAAAVAAIVLNGLGAFRSERKVAGGLSGTLGSGSISPWEEWRQGGTLFSGPSYETTNLGAERDRLMKRKAELEAMGEPGLVGLVAITDQLALFESRYAEILKSSEAQSKVIQDSFDAMRKSAGEMATALGLSSENALKFTTRLGGEKGLNFEGLTPEQQQAKLTEALATANNELAMQVIGTWKLVTTEITSYMQGFVGEGENRAYLPVEQVTTSSTTAVYTPSEFAKDGEKAIDTLTRLATSLTAVNATFAKLGYTLYDASLAGGDLASKFADAFGGLEAMATATSSFFQNFYSAKEQKDAVERELKSEFAKLNLQLPDVTVSTAREQFRQIAEAQDRSTEEGMKTYATLIKLSEAFASITPAIEDTTQSLDDLLKTLTDAVTAARDTLKKAYEKSRDEFQSTVNTFRDIATNLKDLKQSLLMGDLTTLTPGQRYAEASTQLDAIVAATQTGTNEERAKAFDKLPSVIEDFLTASREYNASGAAYVSDFDKVQAILSAAYANSSATADVAQLQLDALTAQLGWLEKLDGSVLSVADALVAYQKALTDLSAADPIEGLYQSIFGRASDAAGKAFWTAAWKGGMSLEAIAAEFKTYDGSHANGLDYVPFDGYVAQLHKGEGVLTRSENQAYMNGSYLNDSTSDAGLTQEVKKLNERIGKLEEALVNALHQSTAANVAVTQEASETLSKAVSEGVSKAASSNAAKRKAAVV